MFATTHDKFLSTLPQTVAVVLKAIFEPVIEMKCAIFEFLEEHRLAAEAVNGRDLDEAR